MSVTQPFQQEPGFFFTCSAILRCVPITISFTNLTFLAGNTLFVANPKNTLEKTLSEATHIRLDLMLQTALLGAVCAVTGLAAVKELCQHGVEPAKEYLISSVRPKGLIHDTFFPSPFRIAEIATSTTNSSYAQINQDEAVNTV